MEGLYFPGYSCAQGYDQLGLSLNDDCDVDGYPNTANPTITIISDVEESIIVKNRPYYLQPCKATS